MRTITISFISILSLSVHAQQSLDNSYLYSTRDLLHKVTNAAGQTDTFNRDHLGRITIYTNPLNQQTKYTYTAGEKPIKVQAANGAVTDFQLYGVDHIAKETSPDRGITNYNYDTAGNLISYTDARGARVETSYDALNRPLVKQVFNNDETIDATYNYSWDQAPYGIGKLASILLTQPNSSQLLTLSYDQAGRVAERKQTRNNIELQANYSYTDSGKLATISYPSANQLTYQYDNFDKVRSISWNGETIVNSISYMPFGSLTELQLGNGIVQQRPFDTAGRASAYSLAGELYQIEYNLAGRIERIASTVNPDIQQSFQYDAAGKLTHFENNISQGTYNYDANANRTSATGEQSSNYTYQRQSNKLATINGQAVVHDQAGNLTQDHRQFTYNALGRLVAVQNGTNQASYDYNALGERSYKNNGIEERLFFYDQEGHLLGEYNAAGQPLVEYAWLGDLPLAVKYYANGEATTYFIESDHLATPRVITDANQQIRWRWDSTPFGETMPNENPANLGALVFNLRFPGQYYDAESGLHYNYFRDYNPTTGRYIQSDPIGLEGGINTYGYVEQNPISYSDTKGLQAAGFNPIKGPYPKPWSTPCTLWSCRICEPCSDGLGANEAKCKIYNRHVGPRDKGKAFQFGNELIVPENDNRCMCLDYLGK